MKLMSATDTEQNAACQSLDIVVLTLAFIARKSDCAAAQLAALLSYVL
jgi:hypothetical protein